MKTIKYLMLGFVLIFGISACELPDNVDPKNPTEVPPETLFTNGMVYLFNQVDDVNVNRNINRLIVQYWQQTTYFDESRYLFLDRNIPDNYSDRFYRWSIQDLKEARAIYSSTSWAGDPADAKNMLAIIEIVEVYGWQCVVDAFGDMPYSDALGAPENSTPTYDDAEAIYTDIINRLDNAIKDLDEGAGGFGSADVLFNGDIASWKKFGASVLMRMGMRLADKKAELSKSTVNKAIAHGVYASQDESALLNYIGVVPHVNAIYNAYVVDNRKDYLPTNTVIDLMNTMGDPRLFTYFTEKEFDYDTDDNNVKIDTEIPAPFDGAKAILIYDDGATVQHVDLPFTALQADTLNPFNYFVGAVAGLDGAQTYANFSQFTDMFFEPTLPAILSDYVEVKFMMAEAAQRGGYNVTGSAEDNYNEAIKASIMYWGGTEAEADAYLATDAAKYDAANWKMSIGTQKWIALYNRGVEGWAEWRRLDYPMLNVPEGMEYSDIPLRMPYPYDEVAQNGANYNAAVEKMGGVDDHRQPLFWDIN